jgi:hypothetical protein
MIIEILRRKDPNWVCLITKEKTKSTTNPVHDNPRKRKFIRCVTRVQVVNTGEGAEGERGERIKQQKKSEGSAKRQY